MKNDQPFIIKSGNNNKSINSYICKVANVLIEKKTINIRAYGNNMNKLVSIVEIIKNSNKENINYLSIKYNIGKDKEQNNEEYINALIFVNENNAIMDELKKLANTKDHANKRNTKGLNNKMDLDDENNKEDTKNNQIDKDDLYIENIDNFFN